MLRLRETLFPIAIKMEKIHTAELTMRKRFVSGHNFNCAEKFYIHLSFSPGRSCPQRNFGLYIFERGHDCTDFSRGLFSPLLTVFRLMDAELH